MIWQLAVGRSYVYDVYSINFSKDGKGKDKSISFKLTILIKYNDVHQFRLFDGREKGMKDV